VLELRAQCRQWAALERAQAEVRMQARLA